MVMKSLGKLTTNARKSFSRESCEPPDPFKVTSLRCLGGWQTVTVDSTLTPRKAIALQTRRRLKAFTRDVLVW